MDNVRLANLINRARDIASNSECKNYKHGAILFNSKNKIISSGCNQYGSIRMLGYNIPTLHAEIHCLKHIFSKNKWRFKGATKKEYEKEG